MNPLEKYAAKRLMTEALIEKLAVVGAARSAARAKGVIDTGLAVGKRFLSTLGIGKGGGTVGRIGSQLERQQAAQKSALGGPSRLRGRRIARLEKALKQKKKEQLIARLGTGAVGAGILA